MSALILTGPDVARLLDVNGCIAAVEEAFRQHAIGAALPPAVVALHADAGAFHIKAAGVSAPAPYFAAKINGNFSGNQARFGLPTIQGILVLADLTNGTPLAIMDSIELTIRRTAAATAVAARHLARDGPSIVTIVGCGAQARAQLQFVAAVRRIAAVHAHDIDDEAARRFARDMAPVIGVPIQPGVDLPRSLAASRIVITCTTSRRPIVHAGQIAPGTFVAAVGADNPEKNEIDAALLASTKVVADVLDQSATIGDLHHAIEAGVMRRDDAYAELGEIVAGRKPGRQTDGETFVFDSTGMALQDVAAAALVYERARRQRAGRSVVFNGADKTARRWTPWLR